jgi:hypothetical protein
MSRLLRYAIFAVFIATLASGASATPSRGATTYTDKVCMAALKAHGMPKWKRLIKCETHLSSVHQGPTPVASPESVDTSVKTDHRDMSNFVFGIRVTYWAHKEGTCIPLTDRCHYVWQVDNIDCVKLFSWYVDVKVTACPAKGWDLGGGLKRAGAQVEVSFFTPAPLPMTVSKGGFIYVEFQPDFGVPLWSMGGNQ